MQEQQAKTWWNNGGRAKRPSQRAEEGQSSSKAQTRAPVPTQDLVPLKQEDQTRATGLLLKMALRSQQSSREFSSVLITTFLLSSNLECIQEVQQAGMEYATLVKQNKDGHGLGSPHLYKWMNFMESLLSMESVQEKEKASLKIFQDYCSKGQMEAALSVPFFKVKECFRPQGSRSPKMVKLQYHLTDYTVAYGDSTATISTVLAAVLTELGGERKVGMAPPEAMDRNAQEILDLMKKA